ncbi:NAD(P)-binding protein [Linderina pennispora]|uniref:3-oxoacyl-[acyl-carrier-protein] reductase n=1 Tax=Linderina pennispora TaxID=61395 RepID=A0A1Y1W2I0_9FUNG|nr:NAD(P)-binding protein [Linderina pennispora]ORX67476.1 NAD(P)-binding protein [Linderina pennispora]
MHSTSNSTNVAIVTGASRGIGKAIVLHLLSEDVSVVGLARSASTLSALSEEVSRLQTSAKFIPIAGDVTDQTVQQQTVDLAAQNGTLVALVNNAGVEGQYAAIASGTVEDLTLQFAVNVIAPTSLIQKALPQLRQSKGRIINLSSALHKTALKNKSGYGASKAALNYITETLALEEPDITAVAIHPGLVETDMTRGFVDRMAVGGAEETAMVDNMRSAMIQTALPGHIIGNLALYADHELSGSYVEYDEPRLSKYAE